MVLAQVDEQASLSVKNETIPSGWTGEREKSSKRRGLPCRAGEKMEKLEPEKMKKTLLFFCGNPVKPVDRQRVL